MATEIIRVSVFCVGESLALAEWRSRGGDRRSASSVPTCLAAAQTPLPSRQRIRTPTPRGTKRPGRGHVSAVSEHKLEGLGCVTLPLEPGAPSENVPLLYSDGNDGYVTVLRWGIISTHGVASMKRNRTDAICVQRSPARCPLRLRKTPLPSH